MRYLSINDSFDFCCTDKLACYNQCCKDLNQFLTPYDILRIKNRLNMPSDIFLEKYTTEHIGPETGLPIITFKTDSADQFKCPFITQMGCSIYEDRPTSCRMYPLARGVSRSRKTGKITEQYALLKEPHCNGWQQDKTWTVKEWIIDQDIEAYNQINDMLLEIISLKNRFMPGRLDIKTKQTFHTACYDLDRFRTQIFEKGSLDNFDIDSTTLESVKNDDTELLKLGFKWLKHTLIKNAGKE